MASRQEIEVVEKVVEKESDKTRSRGKMWSDEATTILIELWSEETIQISLENCKTSRETGQVYKTLLVQLQNKGYEEFNVKELTSKMKKLRQKYKSEKDKRRRSGTGSTKQWKYFPLLDMILSKRHNVNPPAVIDTLGDHKESSDNEDGSNSVEELMQRYGPGDIMTERCPSCGYEQDIHSSGVHVSEGGTVKIYAEADEFVCPICTPTLVIDDESIRGEEISDKSQDMAEKKKKEKEKKEKPGIAPKKKRKSNMEKSLQFVFDQLKDSSNEDFARYQRLEEDRLKKEHDFQMQRMAFENERRKEEREHEMNMMRMMMGFQPQHAMPAYQPQFPIAGTSIGSRNSDSGTTSSNDSNVYFQL